MVASNLEKIFFHYIQQNRELLNIVKPRFFEVEAIRKMYEITGEFVQKYAEIPTEKQMRELCKMKGYEDILESTKLESIYDVQLSEYDPEWLKESCESWVEYKNLDISVVDLISYLKTTKVNSENVKDVVQTAKSIIADRNNIQFNFDEGLDFFNPESHLQPTSDTFSSGFDYIDLVLGGGFYSKALFCFIGEMKIGKCLSFETEIAIRNKKTGLIETVQIGDFHKRFINLPS